MSEIKNAIIWLLGLFTAGVAVKFILKSKSKNATRTVQKNNIVGGDQAGRDINK